MKKWIIYLCTMSALWLIGAILATTLTYGSQSYPNEKMCIISGVYLFILFLIIMVANITRVRMLMFMTSLYSIGVTIRSIFGVLVSILIIDTPQDKLWFSILDVLVLPFTGFYYIASLLTSHFVTEIYWIGLVCISMIILCFSLVGFMAVTGRNKKTAVAYNDKKHIDDMIRAKRERIEENNEFLEKISYNDKKD